MTSTALVSDQTFRGLDAVYDSSATTPSSLTLEVAISGYKVIFEGESPPAPWLQDAFPALATAVDLPEDWDSYGACRVDRLEFEAALQLLVAVMPQEAPAPIIVATSRGGLQLEWHETGVDIEIETLPGGQFDALFEFDGEEATWQGSLNDDLDVLRSWLSRLVR